MMSRQKLRNTAEVSLLLFGTADRLPNQEQLQWNRGGNGKSATCNVLLCFNLKSDISSSQQCLFIKHYKQLNPVGSTHAHPHQLLLKHTLTLILRWHKQYLKRILSIKNQNLLLAVGWTEQTFFSFYTVFFICIHWFKIVHTSHHLKLNESEAVNFYFLKLYFFYVFKENKYWKTSLQASL